MTVHCWTGQTVIWSGCYDWHPDHLRSLAIPILVSLFSLVLSLVDLNVVRRYAMLESVVIVPDFNLLALLLSTGCCMPALVRTLQRIPTWSTCAGTAVTARWL